MFPKKNRRQVVVNGTTFYYKNIGCIISTIMNEKTGELIKYQPEWKAETESTMTPKDVEKIIRKHYNWLTI